MRRGDVALLCSDGLHGPVADEELLAILIAEPNLQKAGEALIQKALDRDGPDNITVVLARFDGEGLQPPAPEDTVGFVGLRPGRRSGAGAADQPGFGEPGARDRRGAAAARHADGRTTFRPRPSRTSPRRRRRAARRRSRGAPRSLLALFMLALVAAATGGIFMLKCEHEPSSKVTLP